MPQAERLRFKKIMGVDPGCGATGWAIIRDGALLECGTIRRRGDIPAAIVQIACTAGVSHAAVQVPAVAGQRAPFFHPRGHMSIVRNAALAGEICGRLRQAEIVVYEVTPRECRRASKMNARLWSAAWEWTGRVSEHARDAAEIARIGMTQATRQEVSRE